MNRSSISRDVAKSSAMLILAVAFLLANSTTVSASAFQASTTASAPADLKLFVGTWTAMHKDSKLMVLELHLENGKLTGQIRTCSFTVDTEGTGEIIEVTDASLTKPLPVRNVSAAGKSLSFDWTDPDGDEVHWKLAVTTSGEGTLNWVQLPAGLKVLPFPVTRQK